MSSCVNTRQALGVGASIIHLEQDEAHDDNISESSASSSIRPVGCALATGLIVSTLITLGIYGLIVGFDWLFGYWDAPSNIAIDAPKLNMNGKACPANIGWSSKP